MKNYFRLNITQKGLSLNFLWLILKIFNAKLET
jgi:hypothetical protein